MSAKKPAQAGLLVDVPHRRYHAEPGTGVFCELWVRGLEKDFDPVKRAYYGFGLFFENGG